MFINDRRVRWNRVAWGVLLGCLASSLAAATPESATGGSVKLKWDLSWEPNIAGYRVHYGPESATYTEACDVGYVVNTELTGLTVGQTYFCAVTAYNTLGLESDYSDEISFTVSASPAETDSDGDGLSDLFETTYGNGADLDPLSDLDGDGLSALAEFVHGMDPTMPMIGPLATIDARQIGEEVFLRLRYLVDPLALNFVTITTERTADPMVPNSWEAGQTVQESSSPSTEHPGMIEIVERSLSPMSAQRMEFFRFRHQVVME